MAASQPFCPSTACPTKFLASSNKRETFLLTGLSKMLQVAGLSKYNTI
jgi:hypothetical protein